MKPLSNLSIIAAMSDNGVIGRDNRLPWRMPADLAHFKRLTMGKPILMGRRTWESLPGLLPHRTHVIVTRNTDYRVTGGHVVHSIEEALERFGDAEELMVVGGENLYRQTLPLASRMYLTLIHAQIEGDACFPEFDLGDWHETSRESHARDARHAHAYSFVTLERC
jgi:dihydrofolate reductase